MLNPVSPTAPTRQFSADPVFGRMHLVRDGFLYAGRIEEVTSQRHSVVLYVALTEGQFELDIDGGRHLATAALVAPQTLKQCRGRGVVMACLDVWPTHRHFRTLARASATQRVLPRERFMPAMDALADFQGDRLDIAGADGLYRQMVELACEQVPEAPPIDPRVRDVKRLMRERPAIPIDELAKAVHLSRDWLVHLFQREMGLSLGKYEQALMLQSAAAFLRRGVSLTEVAAIAGFADSSHFSKMWKRHFGFPPQRLFAGAEVTVDPLPWPPCVRVRQGAEDVAAG